jgi:hypothetical protein
VDPTGNSDAGVSDGGYFSGRSEVGPIYVKQRPGTLVPPGGEKDDRDRWAEYPEVLDDDYEYVHSGADQTRGGRSAAADAFAGFSKGFVDGSLPVPQQVIDSALRMKGPESPSAAFQWGNIAGQFVAGVTNIGAGFGIAAGGGGLGVAGAPFTGGASLVLSYAAVGAGAVLVTAGTINVGVAIDRALDLATFKSGSQILASNIQTYGNNVHAPGTAQGPFEEPHHLVLQGATDVDSVAAQGILSRFNINIHSELNGILLRANKSSPGTGIPHRILHTLKYRRYVRQKLENAVKLAPPGQERQAVIDALNELRTEIFLGTVQF